MVLRDRRYAFGPPPIWAGTVAVATAGPVTCGDAHGAEPGFARPIQTTRPGDGDNTEHKSERDVTDSGQLPDEQQCPTGRPDSSVSPDAGPDRPPEGYPCDSGVTLAGYEADAEFTTQGDDATPVPAGGSLPRGRRQPGEADPLHEEEQQ